MVKETREERRQREKEEAQRLAQETLDKMKARQNAAKEDIKDATSQWSFGKFLTLVAIVGPLVLIALSFNTFNSAQQKRIDCDSAIDAVKNEIKDLKSKGDKSESSSMDNEYVIDTINSAYKLGVEVEKAENEYSDVIAAFNADPDNEAKLQAITDYSASMDKYFSNASARVPWYPSIVPSKWTFETTYDFVGESMPVLWTCHHNETGELLAYATGVYNVAAKQFNNVEYVVTKKGKEYKSGFADDNDGTIPETDSSVFDGEDGDDKSSDDKPAINTAGMDESTMRGED